MIFLVSASSRAKECVAAIEQKSHQETQMAASLVARQFSRHGATSHVAEKLALAQPRIRARLHPPQRAGNPLSDWFVSGHGFSRAVNPHFSQAVGRE